MSDFCKQLVDCKRECGAGVYSTFYTAIGCAGGSIATRGLTGSYLNRAVLTSCITIGSISYLIGRSVDNTICQNACIEKFREECPVFTIYKKGLGYVAYYGDADTWRHKVNGESPDDEQRN